MNAAALIDDLRRRGVQLEARGDRLRFKPASSVPPDLLADLRANKAQILAALSAAHDAPARGPKPLPGR